MLVLKACRLLVLVPHCRKAAARVATCSTHIGTAVVLITSKYSRHTQALGSTHSTRSTNIQGIENYLVPESAGTLRIHSDALGAGEEVSG